MTFYSKKQITKDHTEGVWKLNKFIKKGYDHEIKNPPNQSITRSLSLSGVTEKELEIIPKQFWEDCLPGIEKITYGKLKITDITYGYVIKAKWGIEAARRWDQDTNFYGREFETDGFVFHVKEEIFRTAKEIVIKKRYEDFKKLRDNPEDEETLEYLRQVVLHTIKHAFLSKLPHFVGLEPNKIGGGYDYVPLIESKHSIGAKNAVYIFDTEIGGTGACEVLKRDIPLFISWMYSARDSLKNCPSGYCPTGYCKRCLYIENCGEVNRNLNRFLASPCFFDKENSDWVYND